MDTLDTASLQDAAGSTKRAGPRKVQLFDEGSEDVGVDGAADSAFLRLAGARFAAAFFAAPFLAVFLAAPFLAVFLAAPFFAALFFTAPLRAVFLATALRAVFFAAAFLAGLFFAAAFFAGFLAAAFAMCRVPLNRLRRARLHALRRYAKEGTFVLGLRKRRAPPNEAQHGLTIELSRALDVVATLLEMAVKTESKASMTSAMRRSVASPDRRGHSQNLARPLFCRRLQALCVAPKALSARGANSGGGFLVLLWARSDRMPNARTSIEFFFAARFEILLRQRCKARSRRVVCVRIARIAARDSRLLRGQAVASARR
jgi:hypothetical protein